MAIRAVQQFEKDAYHVIGYKSAALKNVIAALRLYHAAPLNSPLRYDLLVDLRDSVLLWAERVKGEFLSRHGPELANEIMLELEATHVEREELEAGDILFRWVPEGVDWAPENLGQRKAHEKIFSGAQAKIISGAQYRQDEVHSRMRDVFAQRRGWSVEELNELLGINIEQSANFVQHVGIYAGEEIVIEVDCFGVYRNPLAKRTQYDLVVRCGNHGQVIANKATRVSRTFHIYPFNDVGKVAKDCYLGTPLIDLRKAQLEESDRKYTRSGGYALQQGVICSHFVNAVLYAALIHGGTISTATDHRFDDIFKVSPAQMWREFLYRQGLWARADACFVGLQHKGNLNREIRTQTLGVGLGLGAGT
jgi:hypothetical protein